MTTTTTAMMQIPKATFCGAAATVGESTLRAHSPVLRRGLWRASVPPGPSPKLWAAAPCGPPLLPARRGGAPEVHRRRGTAAGLVPLTHGQSVRRPPSRLMPSSVGLRCGSRCRDHDLKPAGGHPQPGSAVFGVVPSLRGGSRTIRLVSSRRSLASTRWTPRPRAWPPCRFPRRSTSWSASRCRRRASPMCLHLENRRHRRLQTRSQACRSPKSSAMPSSCGRRLKGRTHQSSASSCVLRWAKMSWSRFWRRS
mmetsp:Transcript_97321/g.279636  ORF Transcript_97321/g.279636 Transcript_97321/m.279636 type:complete len:253 (-) Transcript_97321:284-1042(-)